MSTGEDRHGKKRTWDDFIVHGHLYSLALLSIWVFASWSHKSFSRKLWVEDHKKMLLKKIEVLKFTCSEGIYHTDIESSMNK